MTSVVLAPDLLPRRLAAAGWKHAVHVRGTLADAQHAVAIVGARAARRESMDNAHALATGLAERGVHVVSGGALGIDGAAHRGALAGGGATTVVLGTGCDVAYPPRHAPLFAQVLAEGGALVSMLPDECAAMPGSFVRRNALIAALADVTIVVEATATSGSLHTARAARKLGRVVCAWPGSPGCDRLIAEGAGIVESVDDVHAALASTPRRPAPVELDPIAREVARALAEGAVDVDGVVARTGLSVRDVLRALPAPGSASLRAHKTRTL